MCTAPQSVFVSDHCAWSMPIFLNAQGTLSHLSDLSGWAFQRPVYNQIFIKADFFALSGYASSLHTMGG